MKKLKVYKETGWTDDKGRDIVIRTEGMNLDEAVDNAELYSVGSDGKEQFYMDGMQLHPDTIESLIYAVWLEAVEKDLDQQEGEFH